MASNTGSSKRACTPICFRFSSVRLVSTIVLLLTPGTFLRDISVHFWLCSVVLQCMRLHHVDHVVIVTMATTTATMMMNCMNARFGISHASMASFIDCSGCKSWSLGCSVDSVQLTAGRPRATTSSLRELDQDIQAANLARSRTTRTLDTSLLQLISFLTIELETFSMYTRHYLSRIIYLVDAWQSDCYRRCVALDTERSVFFWFLWLAIFAVFGRGFALYDNDALCKCMILDFLVLYRTFVGLNLVFCA